MRTDRPETAGGGSRGGSSGIVRLIPRGGNMNAKIKQAHRNTQIINENNKLKAKPTKAEAKANARGLKAANKPTSKNNRSVGPKTSTYVSDTLKNMKPANPKVTRGGSMKSKLNFPKSK